MVPLVPQWYQCCLNLLLPLPFIQFQVPAAKMEPAVTGAGTLNKVTISSLALLKIVQQGTRALPDLCAGCILGLDDGIGHLEVTDCFAYPAGGSDEDDDEGFGHGESDAAQFREDMLKLLRDCNVDDFCVGWYTTVNTGDWCNATLIEQQFEHQEDCDQGTGKAKSCLLVYDPHQSERGVLSLKAFRLTDAFMEVMRARSNQDPRLAQAADSALSRFKMSDIFYEIPIDVADGSTFSTLALMDLTVGRSSNHQAFDTSNISLERLVLSTDPVLEKNVSFAIEELDTLQEDQQRAAQFQKTLQKQKQNQDTWLEQRRKENALRQERGEELLPMVDPSNPIFKVLRDTTKLSSLLMRKQVDIYCEQINDWSAQSFEKLFLLGAVQQQQSLAPSSTSL